jgi:2-oxoisovalerate dehydrogenase E1 component alpha subunit
VRPSLLHLSIPEAGNGLAGRPAWTDLATIDPGSCRRPDEAERAEDIRDLAYGLIRVLSDEGIAVGPWDPHLAPEVLVAGLRHMMVVRELDRRMLSAQRQGKTSFYMQCTGEEAIACAFRVAMRDGDMSFPTYRQQGLLVAGGYPLELMMSQVYSNELDPLRGRQMPVFYSARSHGFFSISGNLATQYIHAVGWAMASALKGDDAIASGWIGEGATAESDFHSAMVFASTYRPPVVLNIVNNQWAISTSQDIARGSSATCAARGLAFGLPALRVDGNDYLAVYAAASWAIRRARDDRGPTVIEWITYRAAAHSSSDDPAGYRPKQQAASWPLGDPIGRLKNHLMNLGVWSERDDEAMLLEVANQVSEAQAIAESHGTLRDHLPPIDFFDGVYKVMPAHLRRQQENIGQ